MQNEKKGGGREDEKAIVVSKVCTYKQKKEVTSGVEIASNAAVFKG